jgi:hypothetical protein
MRSLESTLSSPIEPESSTGFPYCLFPLCSCVPVFLCSCVPVFLCSCVSVFLCSCVHLPSPSRSHWLQIFSIILPSIQLSATESHIAQLRSLYQTPSPTFCPEVPDRRAIVTPAVPLCQLQVLPRPPLARSPVVVQPQPESSPLSQSITNRQPIHSLFSSFSVTSSSIHS